MARMSKAKTQTLERYRTRVNAAKSFRKKEELDDLWDRLVDMYRGKQFDHMSYEDQVVVNIAFATINVILPSVAINYPKVTVSATKLEAADSAEIAEAVINYQWRHFDFQPEIQAAVKDYLIVGFGWLKCGWRYVEEDVLDRKAMEEEFMGLREQAANFAAENPELSGDLPEDRELAEQVVGEYTSQVVEDAPFVERVPFKDVFVDPEATCMRDAKWIAHKVVKTLEEVKDDEAYDRTARAKVRPDTQANVDFVSEDSSWRGTQPDDQDFKRVTVWEFYDIKSGQMAVFSENGDRFLVEPTAQPYSFGHPFVMLRNFDVPDQFYPMGDLEAVEPLQMELNMTRSAMFNDRKAFRRKWLYRRDAIDRKARQALESNDDNVFVPIDGSEELDKVIAHMPTAAPNQALYQDTEIIESDVVKVTGLSDYQRGETPEIRRTATEASIIQDAANARAADKLARVEKTIAEVARRLLQLNQQYLDGDDTFRFTGINGQPIWLEYSAEDIEGEFDFEVEGGSTQPKNEQTRRRAALDLLQGLGPLMDPQIGIINPHELIRHVLKDGFGIQDPERFLAGGQDPVTAGMGDPNMALEDQVGPEEAALMQQMMLEQGEGPPQGGAITGPAADGLTPEMIAELTGDNGGAIPPGIAQQLAGQVGLSLG